MILWQLQLSLYNEQGKFVFTADSNWQMMATKLLNMLKLNPELYVDILVPDVKDCAEGEKPAELLWKLLGQQLFKRVKLLSVPIAPSALRTRYDFPYESYKKALDFVHWDNVGERYTHVYVNDPMFVGNLKTLFQLEYHYQPMFIVQTHFLDSPTARIVPKEVEYWHSQVVGNLKADVCLWHCKTMEQIFFDDLGKDYQQHIVENIMKKSDVWKDGYSTEEIRKPVDVNNVRFLKQFEQLRKSGKKIVWVPNRVGGLGRSSDYTNCGKFLFELVPELWKTRQDFIILAGNPNQKISNDEIAELCPAYVKLVDTALNRDEYRFLSQNCDIVGAFYTVDTNGGYASLEAVEFGAIPLYPNLYEYKVYFDAVNWPDELRGKPDLSDIGDVLGRLIDTNPDVTKLQKFVREYASYEHTTEQFMKKYDLL